MKVKKGMKFRNVNNIKAHVVNIFKDGDEQVITYKYWLKHKQRWAFETKYMDVFLVMFHYGYKWEK